MIESKYLPATQGRHNRSEVIELMEIYDFTVRTIEGFQKSLDDYRGKVVLIVNTASKCGFTPQYEGLQELYRKYKDRGFVVLGFPSNDFMRQEPGTSEEIKQFCEVSFGVKFPMFEKIKVRGRNKHPLYEFLTSKKTNPGFGGSIKWNFTKFLIDREGRIINRFSPNTSPESIEPEITRLL